MPTKSTRTRNDDRRKDYIDTKGPKQRNCHNLPTNDVEDINSTNKGRDLLIAIKPRFIPWRTERMLQRIQWHSRITIHRSTHQLNESKTRRKNLAMAWINYKKAYDMVPHSWIINSLKMYKISHEVINFILSIKFMTSCDMWYENLESGIDSRRKKLSWSKDPKRYFPRRCSITLTIHNCHDPT